MLIMILSCNKSCKAKCVILSTFLHARVRITTARKMSEVRSEQNSFRMRKKRMWLTFKGVPVAALRLFEKCPDQHKTPDRPMAYGARMMPGFGQNSSELLPSVVV